MTTDNSTSNSSNPQISGASFGLLDKQENPKVKKVGFDLLSLQQEYESNLNQNNEVLFQSSNRSLSIMEGSLVIIDAVAAKDPNTLLADLQGLGMKNTSSLGSMVSGLLPIESIDELANLNSLKFAQPATARTNVGSTTSQADAAMNADFARNSFGVDGSGVTVGVLSDSYDDLGGAFSDVASGDLPGVGNSLGNTTPVNVLQDFGGSASDEGRAMLQLVHDVAPGAELGFHTANGGQAAFANGIIDLANVAGSDVIVDDIIYLAEPMFQDGMVAQAVDTVVADGVSYFSSAGNNARNAYESTFNPVTIGGLELHDFDPGTGVDVFQSITVPQGSGFTISFQWDSPFFSVSGGAASPNDLDIFVLDSTGSTVLESGENFNIGNDPVEVFSFFNDGSHGSEEFNIAISNFTGPDAGLMKYVMFEDGNITINEFDTASGTLYGHANANGAEAVGAAFYQDTPRFGTDPAVLENFSSPGPTPILFETDGTPTNELRQKPEIVAPDGTNTTFFGGDVEGDGFPNFFGTSAAAPHAAAVAALMLEAAPGTNPADIYATLENTALDMDDPFTPAFDVGVDDATGYGLIQADKAVEELVTPFTPFDPEDDPQNLIDAIVTDDNLTILLDDEEFPPEFTGGEGQTSFYDGSLIPLEIDAGILLTSGDGTPALTNTAPDYRISLGGVGDADLDAVAAEAFSGAGTTEDANLLEFSFEIDDHDVKSITFDLVFGSEEFPEFSNSSFVDVAGVFVNDRNYAYFNNDLTQPLSIIDNNLEAGNFTDNTDATLPIEYDGISDVLTIFAPVEQGKNTIKFGVADTGDQIYDSGLFISNLATSTLGDEDGSGVLVNITGTEGDNELIGSEINEFIDAGAGNDTINPGLGNDVVDAGAGDDTIFGGGGDNEIDGGDGIDTVIYSGNQSEFKIEKIGDVIKVGSNTDTLSNVEFLSFDDGTISATDIKPVDQNSIITEDVDGTTIEAIDLTGSVTDKVTVDYTISREADFDNEVYFYKIDDITGSIGGVAVGEDGYLEAALTNLISPVFSTSDDNTETGSVEFDAGSLVVPLIIADGNVDEALSGEAEVYFSYLGSNSDNGTFDHIQLLNSNTFGFEDLPNGGDGDFNDIIIEINSIA